MNKKMQFFRDFDRLWAFVDGGERSESELFSECADWLKKMADEHGYFECAACGWRDIEEQSEVDNQLCHRCHEEEAANHF